MEKLKKLEALKKPAPAPEVKMEAPVSQAANAGASANGHGNDGATKPVVEKVRTALPL